MATATDSQSLRDDQRYTSIAILLHWIIAVLILCNIILGISADYLPDSFVRNAVDLHKSLGITALGLVLVRIFWRLGHRPPSMPESYPRVEVASAHAAHFALYFLILAIPLTGWIHDSAWSAAATHPLNLFWSIPWFRLSYVVNLDPEIKEKVHSLFGAAHTYFGYILYVLVALHIAGALKHQFLDKQPELKRMWF